MGYKIIKTTPELKKYMDVALAAGNFYKNFATYHKSVVNLKGFDNYTFINSIKDIVENVDRFNQQIQECYDLQANESDLQKKPRNKNKGNRVPQKKSPQTSH